MYNVILYEYILLYLYGDHCRSKTDTERQDLGHIVEQRIKNYGDTRQQKSFIGER